MSATFYELLKYAATGIASPDMTYYDRMRASTLMGGVVKTLTGQPPLTFKADGTPLISWSMLGNGSQTGTPTPDNPVMPEFVGARTGNLFDKSTITAGNYATTSGTTANNSYYCSDFIPITAATYYFQNVVGGGYQNTVVVYDANKQGLRYVRLKGGAKVSGAITFQSGDAYIRINCYYQTDVNTVMLNTGSTALPYEPFGWAEKITCSGQTIPVYLGEVPTVRRVKKLVLDGTEGWTITSNSVLRIGLSGQLRPSTPLCTHYLGSDATAWSNVPDKSVTVSISGYLAILDTTYTTAADFKAYLADEYAAGTPVTVWYVLAEPQTGIVNEPLAKIGDYADELSSEDAAVTIPTVKGANTLTVGGDLQPSEMTITYRG